VKLAVIGCNHKSAPVEVRERLAFDRQGAGAAIRTLAAEHPSWEAVLLSTCNRVELYIATGTVEEAEHLPWDPVDWLCSYRGIRTAEVRDRFYRFEGVEAVRHLLQVASGLDSMVLGETQILGQVKDAYDTARAAGTTGPILNILFQQAVAAAKQVHANTGLSRGRVSVSSVAVEFACQVFDPDQFRTKTVLLIGAGKMGELTLRHLIDLGPGRLLVTNRSPERAAAVASRWEAEAVPYDALDDWLVQADLIISTTASAEPIVDRERFARVMERRRWRPVVIIDIAVPRDFTDDVGDLENVYLYNIDDLESQRDRNLAAREREVGRALAIVDQMADETWARLEYQMRMAPVVSRLREQIDQIREEELRRLFRGLPELTDKERERIAHAFRRFENKVLHLPASALREEGQNGSGRWLLDALERLFHLKR